MDERAVSLTPSGLGSRLTALPTACAAGLILSPLPGFGFRFFLQLLEDVFHFADQRPEQGLVVDFEEPIEFLQQFLLAFVQLAGNLYTHFDIEVALAVSIQDGDSLVTNAEGRPGLCSLGDLQGVLALHGGHANFGTHGGLRHGNWNNAVQGVPFPFKKRMLLDVKHDIQVASRTAELADLARAGEANAGSILYARRNFCIHRALAQQAALAFALRAGIGNHAAASLARGTGARDAEESLLITHLPAPVARAAGGRPFAGSRTGATALFACFVATNRDPRFGAEECIFKFERQILAQIGAAL